MPSESYDTRDYKRVIDEANLLEEERKKLKAAQMEQKLATGEEAADSSESENDEQSEFRLKVGYHNPTRTLGMDLSVLGPIPFGLLVA